MATLPSPRSPMPVAAPRSLCLLLLIAVSLLVLPDVGAGSGFFSHTGRRSLRRVNPSRFGKRIRPHGLALTRQAPEPRGTPSVFQRATVSSRALGTFSLTNNNTVGISNAKAGPVLSSPIPIYIAWVGNVTDARKKMLRDFVTSLNPQQNSSVTVDDWWMTSTAYWGGTFKGAAPTAGWVSSSIAIKGERDVNATDLASWGLSSPLQEADPWTIVTKAITAASWPVSSSAAYFAFSSEAYRTINSCYQYCGFHSNKTFQGIQLAYAWVGALTCKTSCWAPALWANSTDGPMQAAINVFAHELAEVVTDPFGTSWYDSAGKEIADKCNLNFGTNSTWNLVGVNDTSYLIQKLWDPQGGNCTLSSSASGVYPSQSPPPPSPPPSKPPSPPPRFPPPSFKPPPPAKGSLPKR